MSSEKDFTKLVNAYLDNETDNTALNDLAVQLNASEACRLEFREAIRLDTLMREIALDEAKSLTDSANVSISKKHQLSRGYWLWGLATAAVLLFVFAWYSFNHPDPGPIEKNEIALVWLDELDIANSDEPLLLSPLDDPSRKGAGGSIISGGGDGGQGGEGGFGTPGGHKIGDPEGPGGIAETRQEMAPELKQFVEQFNFDFYVPESLPVNWQFVHGRALSEMRVQLIYNQDNYTLNVFIWPDPGPDKNPFEYRNKRTQKFTVLRSNGLAIAFSGGEANDDIWLTIGQLFLPLQTDKNNKSD